MKPFAQQVHEAVAAVAPITGVSIGSKNDKATWRIDFEPNATSQQKVAAQTAVSNFEVGE